MAKKDKTPAVKKKFNLSKKLRKTLLGLTVTLCLLLALITVFEIVFQDKILPRVYIGDSQLTYLTPEQATRVVESKIDKRLSQKLDFKYKDQTFSIDLATSSADINTSLAVDQAFRFGHSGPIYQQAFDQLKLLIGPKNISPKIALSLSNQDKNIANQIHKTPQDAILDINEEATISAVVVKDGSSGQDLDQDKLEKNIKDYLTFGEISKNLPVKEVKPTITTEKAEKGKDIVDGLIREPVKLIFNDQNWTIDSKTLITFLDLSKEEIISTNKIKDYLKDVSQQINQPVVEALFNFDSTNQRVTAFKAAQQGRELDIDKSTTLITLALNNERSKIVTLPVSTVEPKITNDKVNNLGIKTLLGRGISNFAGSIPNRIYNVGLAASRINGTLVPPGQTFSFTNQVGEISGASGYKQAYVINNGRTVLDDGGGVCQDSTTLFRAVLNAGLPVVQRVAHAYRVGYYEQGFPPGIDATIYSPTVDFKFKNDTPGYVLIQAYVVGSTTLYVDLYGTSDGRTVTVSTPVIGTQTPPPPELRQDDPTLPKGEVKQVDFAAWGANVSFNRTVKRDGQTIINETFRSNYKPWQAVYLVGTKEN